MVFPIQRPINIRNSPVQNPPNNFWAQGRGFNPPVPQSRNPLQNIIQSLFKSQGSYSGVATQGGGGFTNTLTNIQQILNFVQKSAPIVQEYGPMVKNLPAMYRMMKAFNENDDENENEESANLTESSNTADEMLESSSRSVETESSDDQLQPQGKSRSGQSLPKLYI
ncbi:VrrA/YqfQ family protein [Virgibacillus byunsanensis]|uniref:VrrA/YqfQ family protein n=1 Tax=Virgibacillus byunsanensis TaxID=570945 RepID=A0ABW3LR99_9BACI